MNLPSTWLDWDRLAARSQAVLPAADSLPWLRELAWSLVLAAGVLMVATARHRRLGLADERGWGAVWVALGVVAWTWAPAAWGLAYWLGLAFQTPSGVSTLLAATYLAREGHARWRGHSNFTLARAARLSPPKVWFKACVAAGVLLGWTLLLDTFALFPVSIYAWGFQPDALAFVLGLALLPWVLGGAAARRTPGLVQIWVALALFGLWRWPSGNVWDALLDPWLWIALNGYFLLGLMRRWRLPD
ncbi:MAG: hypothetical protein QE283_04965 [Rhodoferax sp.]|nr:hypothetical protein [Rhodoferax sp.]